MNLDLHLRLQFVRYDTIQTMSRF